MPGLVVGEGQDGVIDDGQRDIGWDQAAAGIAGKDFSDTRSRGT